MGGGRRRIGGRDQEMQAYAGMQDDNVVIMASMI
jgi:hypothetical protein